MTNVDNLYWASREPAGSIVSSEEDSVPLCKNVDMSNTGEVYPKMYTSGKSGSDQYNASNRNLVVIS